MRITLFESHFRARPDERDVSWEELVALLTPTQPPVFPPRVQTTRTAYDLPCWRPGFADNGGNSNDDMTALSALVLDFDDQTIAQWRTALEKVEAAGVQYAYHSTRKHAPIDGKLRYRLVLRLSRNVLAREWREFWGIAAPYFEASQNDKSCKDESRIFYSPCQVEGMPGFECGSGGRIPLDVDLVLEAGRAEEKREAAPDHAETRARLQALAERKPKSEWQLRAWTALRRLLLLEPGEYAPPGDRDNTLYAVAGFVARRAPTLDHERIVEALRPGLEAAAAGGECRHADGSTLLEKLGRQSADLASKLQNSDPIKMFQLGRSGPYTEEEVSTFVAEQELPDASYLKSQVLVAHQQTLYAFYEGSYIWVGTKESGELSARQKLVPAEQSLGVALMKVNKDGELVERPWREMLRNHCRAVDIVTPSLSARTTTVQGHRMTIAACPRSVLLVPVFDDRVDKWLRSWGDDTLLDWLATAARLDKATAALYLCGPPLAGKTMLAEGLAAVWGSPPTMMESLDSSFNDSITDNPVILADDTIPERFRKDSGALRQMITARTITLNRKYMPSAKLEGSLRFIFAMNNLRLFESNESVGRDDVEAICQRLLFYRLHAPSEWFSPTRLAQHILWLEENRVVEIRPNERLWVSGRESELHRHMRVSSRERALVCHWLMNFLHGSAASLSQFSGRMFRLGGGELLINPRLIYEKFDVLLPKERQLSLAAVAKVMNELGRARGGGLFTVSLEDLSQWAAENAWATSVAELRAVIDAVGNALERRAN